MSANWQRPSQGGYGNQGSQPYQPPSYGPAPVPPNQRRVESTERQKDHIAAGLLAIFLGAFGIHKFYLGYNRAGFIMLATSIIGGIVTLGLAASVMSVIALVEGVIYLVKSQADFDQIYVYGQRDWF